MRWVPRRVHTVLLLALSWPAVSASLARQCCGPGIQLDGKKCADGTDIALDCVYRFLLDSAQGDRYSQQDDGTLEAENITYTEGFCLALMPHDVAVVCQEDQEPDDPRPAAWFEVLRWLTWLSVACMALTFAAHLALPELGDLQGRCHMGAVASLGTGMLALSVLQDASFTGTACTAMAFFAYYWWLSAFVWLHITSFNVWRSVVFSHKRFRERSLFAWYCVASFGLPLLLLAILATAHFLPDTHSIMRPHIGRSKCWFHDDRSTWAYFYGPSSLLIAPNVVYFVWTTTRLWRQYSGDTRCRRKLVRRRFLLSLKLFLVMGISWAFELISSASKAPGHFMWYLTDLFNAMQGLVILVVLVLARRRVWRALYKRQPCGLRPPERWAFPSGPIDECGDSTDSEEDDEAERCEELKEMGRHGNGKA